MRLRILIATVLLAVSVPGALILHRHTDSHTKHVCKYAGYAGCNGVLDVPGSYVLVTTSARPSWGHLRWKSTEDCFDDQNRLETAKHTTQGWVNDHENPWVNDCENPQGGTNRNPPYINEGEPRITF